MRGEVPGNTRDIAWYMGWRGEGKGSWEEYRGHEPFPRRTRSPTNAGMSRGYMELGPSPPPHFATTLKKLVWLLTTPARVRSMRGDSGRPIARSWSPCWNISSCSACTHLQGRGEGELLELLRQGWGQ